MSRVRMVHFLLVIISVVSIAAHTRMARASEPVHWAYQGEAGPEHWGELSETFAACAEGNAQSPIDIPAAASVNPAEIVFNYEPSALNIVNSGHTIRVDYDQGSAIELEGTRYPLLQFHFHALSEHTIAGAHRDMEMHLVHQSADGVYAVVGVMIKRGAENPAYSALLNAMPAQVGEVQTIEGARVRATDLLPQARTFYRYDGSFTTPPCTEGVRWVVLNEPVELSSAQVALFEQLYSTNYRPVQPLNGRALTGEAGAPATLLPSEVAGLPLPLLLVGLGLLLGGGALFLRRSR